MADEEAENIGGISVSIGASHAQLVSDLNRADQLLEAWAKQRFTVQIGASVSTPATAVRQQAAPSIVVGARAQTAVQAQQGQTALQRAIQSELSKTGERYNSVTGEIEAATQAATRQKNVIVDVQQAAAHPTAVNIDFGDVQKEAQALLATLREVVATTKELAAQPPPKARRPRAKSSATSGGEGDGEAEMPTRIQIVDQLEKQRRQAAGGGIGVLDISRSEQSLNRQRQREETANERQRQQAATQSARTQEQSDRQEREQSLNELSAQAEADARARGGNVGSTFITEEMTQKRRGEIEAERQAAAGRTRATRASAVSLSASGPIDPVEAERRRLVAELDAGRRGGSGAGGRGPSEEDIARRAEQRIASSESSRVAAGRTARTTASGFGGQFLFGGPAREQAEAVARQSQAEQNLGRIRRLANDPAIIRDARAYRQVTQEQAVAEKDLEKATQRVQDLAGKGTAIRSLAAVTVAGAAFGVGLQAIGVAADLVGRALDPTISRMLGFSNVAGRVTDALSDQTKQANGNAQAVVSLAAAQAGLSASAARAILPLVTEQVSIEAGNKNLGEAIDLFETYQKLRQQGVGGITSQTGGFLGSGFFGTRSTSQELGRLFQGLPSQASRTGDASPGVGFTPEDLKANPFLAAGGPQPIRGPSLSEASANLAVFNEGLKFANDQLDKGGESTLRFTDAQDDAAAIAKSIAAAQAAGATDLADSFSSAKVAISGLSDDTGTAAAQIQRLLQAFNTGFQQPDQGLLQAQFNRQNPALIAAAGRQIQYAVGTQQPTQFALGALANPDLAVGTGIAPEDQQKVAGALKEAGALQDQLNTKYAQGQQLIEDTYRPAIVTNFGNAAAQAFDASLNAIKTTGAAIAQVQTDISNEQAAYQAAQYNFQLQIAKRSLSDIGGLIGKNLGAGQSQLGILEGENLALSRQGQQLQFNLSQRQINFQRAKAGFQAPGVTPEERQANVREAQIETSYAQKQLDIQRQMFGNQVRIVDISNLRQGRDLVRQINLLTTGRQVTLDTAAAEQKIQRLNKLQSQNVAQVGTYLSAVDGLVSTAIGQIQQLEAAAGKAMQGVAVSVLSQFGVLITGLTQSLGGAGGPTPIGGNTGKTKNASGGAYGLTSPTTIGANGLAGEAGDETLIILSHPRSASSGSNGGGNLIVNFNGPIGVRSEADIDAIARKVGVIIGQQAALKGFRSLGSSG